MVIVIHDTQSAQISQKQDGRNIYVIMKTMCPLDYHHNGFMAARTLGHMMYGYTLLVPKKLHAQETAIKVEQKSYITYRYQSSLNFSKPKLC